MANIIVSDAGPVITLEKMSDGFNFIRLLFEKIVIPSTVLKEVSEGNFSDPLDYLERYGIEDLVEIKTVHKISTIAEIERLDEGEKEAISLAYQMKLPLLIEETMGRKIALSANIKLSGIAGQIVKAYKSKLIKQGEAKSKLQEIFRAGRINRKIYSTLIDSL